MFLQALVPDYVSYPIPNKTGVEQPRYIGAPPSSLGLSCPGTGQAESGVRGDRDGG